MSARMNPRDTALSMMEAALPLLDEADERLAACYLQQAVDLLNGQKALLPGEQVDPALAERLLSDLARREE